MKELRRTPSLRRRLLISLLLPATILAIVLGAGGVWLVQSSIEVASDRLLDGSVLAIAERLVFEDNEVTVDIPPVALGMIESQTHDSIYYGIFYEGALVTGYKDLPTMGLQDLVTGQVVHWNATYRGARVRIGAQLRRLYGAQGPILVEVAETGNARETLEWRMYSGLILLESGLLAMVAGLTWRAVGRGLLPLTDLGTEIDGRGRGGMSGLSYVSLKNVPREALPLATALNALLDRLGHSITAFRRFTADASHQMRTPLASLRMHIELLRRDDPSETQAATLDVLELASARLERLLAQLLALAYADEDKSDAVDHVKVDLRVVAEQTAATLALEAIRANIDLQFEAPGHEVLISGDAILIEQIIVNLVDNAIRYNRAGGTVILRITELANLVRLEVEDDGPGIATCERERVFDRFYRISRQDNPDGSGLGLSIVRAVADRLGALVDLRDGPGGRGLLVIVTFNALRT